MDCFVLPAFHDGSGSTGCAVVAVVAAPMNALTTMNRRIASRVIAPPPYPSQRFHQPDSKMVRRSTDIALTARANHVARAVLIGAQEGAAAMDAFHHARFARIERGCRTARVTSDDRGRSQFGVVVRAIPVTHPLPDIPS